MYWYDGKAIDSQFIELAVNAPELSYGASVFTTLRIYDKSLEHELTQWQAHCDRLKYSLNVFSWQQPDWKQILAGALFLAQKFPVVRIAIFPNGRELIVGRNLPSDLAELQLKGIVAWIARGDLYKRELAQHKTGNYLAAYLAREKALSHNAREAILIDRQGNWLETSTGNLWGWSQNCWYTPKLNQSLLPGIQRAYIGQYLQDNQITVRENTWTADFVLTLEAIYYSNSIVEMIPIGRILDLGKIANYPILNFDWQNKLFQRN